MMKYSLPLRLLDAADQFALDVALEARKRDSRRPARGEPLIDGVECADP